MIRIFVTLALLLSACDKPASTSSTPAPEGEQDKQPAVETPDQKVTSTKIGAGSTETQTLTAPADSAISGANVSFPPGSFSSETEISLAQGADVGTSDFLTKLSLTPDAISNAAVAVSITASPGTVVNQDFSLNLPLPPGSSLFLQGDTFENLAIVFIGNGGVAGIIGRAQIEIVEGFAVIKTRQFGTFQAVIMKNKSDAEKTVTINPAATNNQAPITTVSAVEIVKTEPKVHQIQIEWEQPVGLQTFNLEASKSNAFDAGVTLIEAVSSPFVYANLDPATEYFFRLSTIVGEKVAVSATKSKKTLPLPVVPENFALQVGNASLEVSWDFKPGHTYEVHYADNVNFAGVQILTAETSPLVIGAISNGVNYYVKINALYLDAKSSATEALAATPQPVPAMPINFSASAGNTQATIAWDLVSNASTYEIYWSLNTPVTVNDNKIVSASDSFVHSSLTNGTTYYYRIAARNPTGLSPLSIEESTQPGVAPSIAPTAVSAQVGDAKLTLDWQPVAGGETYEIFYKGSTGVSDTDPKLTSTTDNYVHMGLTNNTPYYYKVRAINNLGVGPLSVEFSSTPIPLPDVPATLTVVEGNSNNSLTWTAATGAASYNLYFSTSAGVTKNDTTISSVTSTYSHTGLTNGTRYYYKIEAVNAAGGAALTSEASGVPGVAPASAPGSVMAAAGDGVASLQWDAVSGAASYELFFNTTGSVTAADTKIDVASVTHSHSSLTNGQTYYYRVRAINTYGIGTLSAEFSASPLAPPVAPASPAASDGNVSTSVTWSSSVNAASYNIYFKTSPGVAETDTKLTGVTSPYSHTGLSNGTTYYYKIEAVNVGGNSPLSAEVSAAAVAAPVAPSPVASIGNTENTLTWSAVTGASSYNLYFTTATGVTSGSGTAITGISSPYNHTGLVNGTAYYYVMRAVGPGGNSVDSSEVTATPNAPPAAPTNVRLVTGDGSLTAYWDEVAGAASYNVNYGAFFDFDRNAVDVQPGVVLESVSGVTYVRVVAVNAAGSSPYSANANLIPGVLGHDFIKVSAGGSHACGIDENHDAYCWLINVVSNNSHGQLGNGTTTATATPTLVSGGHKWRDITAGGLFSCGISEESYLYCWGVSTEGQSFTASVDQLVPNKHTSTLTYTSVIAGPASACATATNNYTYCWGNNSSGQLGTGNTVSTFGPDQDGGGINGVQPSVGDTHACHLDHQGAAFCSGANSKGELGRGGTVSSEVFVAVNTAARFRELSVGDKVTCGLTTESDVLCWGDDTDGQLGNGNASSTYSDTPTSPLLTNVTGSQKFRQIDTGGGSTCAVSMEGVSYCWGKNSGSQVVPSNTTPVHLPTVRSGWNLTTNGAGATVSVSGSNLCVLTSRGDAWCGGQLTSGTLTPRSNAGSASSKMKKVAAGKDFTCGLSTEGEVACWGDDTMGQLGNGAQLLGFDYPKYISLQNLPLTTRGFIDLTVGENHACAITVEGPAYCWGKNDRGQVGIGTTSAAEPVPVAISGSHLFLSLTAGSAHTCGITAAGTGYCWGSDDNGRLGNGAANTDSSVPVAVTPTPADLNWKGISAGDTHTCGWANQFALYCWGADDQGQLSNSSSTADQSVPNLSTNYSPGPVAGYGTTLSISFVGTMQATGNGEHGILSNNDASIDRDMLAHPSPDDFLTMIKADVSETHACAIDSFSKLRCWGRDTFQQLGNGPTQTDLVVMTPIAASTTVFNVAVGNNHTCWIKMNGDLQCWGSNAKGQAGTRSSVQVYDAPSVSMSVYGLR